LLELKDLQGHRELKAHQVLQVFKALKVHKALLHPYLARKALQVLKEQLVFKGRREPKDP
jgi:hypothetical protein